ncbi:MAG: hypothetical protein J0H95_07200 [Xanthomonadales bacterium]|nr:hypothetical protein [Xanthomonadales bacterium]
MDLKEFVKETIVQIASGVREAQEAVRPLGAIVNPASLAPAPGGGSYFATIQDMHHVFLVDFDVAVSVSETAGTNASAKLNVATLLSLGAGGQSGNSTAATNRLSFKVPLALPLDEPTRARLTSEIEAKRIDFSKPLDYPNY